MQSNCDLYTHLAIEFEAKALDLPDGSSLKEAYFGLAIGYRTLAAAEGTRVASVAPLN